MKPIGVRARDLWLGVMVAGFVLMTASLALQWWAGAWIALGIGLAFSVAFWRLHMDVERERVRWHGALDAMETAVVLYDRDDRVVFANADFKRLYGLADAQVARGTAFEQLLRDCVQAGQIPAARGQEEAWIAERAAQHRERRGGSALREMGNGRWRRVTEQPLANGGMIGYSIDVTELVEHERALEAARAEAETAHRLLRDAIEAIPAGIEVYDEQDRLVLFNRRLAAMYPHVAEQMSLGQTFEVLVRRSIALGMVTAALGREDEWLADRLARRVAARGDTPLLQQIHDGRWMHIYESRGVGGSIVGVRLDVTDLVRQREELAAAHARAEAAHALLRDAIEAMPAAVEVYDADDRLVLFNQRMLSLYPHMDAATVQGQTFEALARRALAQGKVPQARGREQAWLAERMALHAAGHAAPTLQQAPDGSWIHIYETRVGSGGIVVVRVDVSEMVRQGDAHRRARELLDDAIEALPDGFALFDADDRLVVCNQRYRDIYAASAPAITPGASFESIVRYGLERGQYPEAQANPEAWIAERLRRHRETDGKPILQQLTGGSWLQIDERRTRSGGIAGARADVTELMQARQAAEASRAEAQAAAAALRDANAALETLSTTDALTGVANRRRFDQRLQEELRRVQRYDAPLTVLLIDVDYFKRYNDHHGHQQGDRALEAVAQVLAQQARRPGELAARYGGEEFAILLPHADCAAGLAVAERCQTAMAQLALPHGHSPAAPYVTLSIGVAQWDASGRETATSLLRRADAALYEAKAAGRARSMPASGPVQARP